MDAVVGMTSPYDVIDDLTGIANAVRSIALDPGSPDVFVVTARMSDTTQYLGVRGDPYNSGAGLTQQDAWDAGVGEAVERYCLSVVQPGRMTFGSWASLPRSAGAIHPSEVLLFEQTPTGREKQHVCSEDAHIGWLPGHSLVDGRDRLVPACVVHIPYAPVHPSEQLIAPAISTGSAAGTTIEQAIVSGLYESIERDAVSIMWLNQWPAPHLLIDEDELASLVADRFARPNLQYGLFLIESDIAAPTVICLIRDTNFDPPLFCIGGAARVDVRDATTKALIECVQGWHWARDFRQREGWSPVPDDFSSIRTFDSRVELYARADMHAALDFLFDSAERVRLSECQRDTRGTEPIIQGLVASVYEAGSDVILIDMTTPDVAELGWHAVKVFCPALQQLEGDHNHRLLGGSRWRDVPVKLGWRTTPLDPKNVNGYPHPYA
jgi:ribosomal protein S12 methylthiotransferase accessory factor